MKTPVIGIPLAEARAAQPGATHKMQYVNSSYFYAVEQAGGLPLGLPLLQEPRALEALLPLCDGFLLPGGADVDPQFYGQPPHPALGSVALRADRAWAQLVACAQREKKPLLGICRGLQLLNTALGGTLYQDLSLRPGGQQQLHMQVPRQERSYPLHRVTIAPDSRLAEVLGVTAVYTNTMHHQCVAACGSGLQVVARADDGVPEAVESSDGLLLAVQWHPEELLQTVPCMRSLFEDLVRRAGR